MNTFGTSLVDDEKIEEAVKKVFDLSVSGNIKALELKLPIYKDTAVYGHFGKKYLPWEKTDKVNDLVKALKKV